MTRKIDKLRDHIATQKARCVENEVVYKEVAVFYAGDSFGEYALIAGKRGTRAARICCKEASSFGVLSSEDYNKSLAKNELR